MSKNKAEIKEEDKELLDGLLRSQIASNAIKKLNNKSLKISVYRHTAQVQATERELVQIDDALAKVTKETKGSKSGNPDVFKTLETGKKSLEENLKKHDNDKIEGILTPLSYRDIMNIKAAATEAVADFKTFKFDPAVALASLVREERFMTVFCALKRLDDSETRYFEELENIALVDDDTIFSIYKKWEDHFVLTEEELKN